MLTRHNAHRDNMPRRAHVLGRALGVIAILLAGAAATARTSANAPSPDVTMNAFDRVEAWVRGWTPPDDEPTDAETPDHVAGAAVTLRLGGRILGRAAVFDDARDPVAHAARLAWIEANARLPVDASQPDAAERTALLASRITIEVELAGSLRPLTGDTFGKAAAAISPGLQGVAAEANGRVEALFPGYMLATNTTPEAAIRVVVSKLGIRVGAPGIPRFELERLRDQHDLGVYRFRTTHLAQVSADDRPIFLHRGGRALARGQVNGRLIRDTADAIVEHLLTHDWPAPEEPHGMVGSYRPWLDAYEPFMASPLQQAMTAAALYRYAGTPGVDPTLAFRARRFADEVMLELQIPTADETDPMRLPDVAMIIVAAAEAPIESPPLDPTFLSNAVSTLRTVATDDDAWRERTPVDQSLLCLALAVAPSVEPDSADLKDLARRRTRALFASTDRGLLVSLMPWLGWAELVLTPTDEPVPAAIALREMRDLTWSYQVASRDVDLPDRDLIGGIVFTRGGAPLPTWHTLRPLAFFASMLGDERLTSSEDRSEELARLITSVRFLIQLSVGPAEARMFQSPEHALGGVRAAIWDQSLPIEASCLGLITICETIRAVTPANPTRTRTDSSESPERN